MREVMEVVPTPAGIKPIGSRHLHTGWGDKKIQGETGCSGVREVAGVDVFNTFALEVKVSSVRLLLALTYVLPNITARSKTINASKLVII